MGFQPSEDNALPYTRQMRSGPDDLSGADWTASRSIVAYGIRVGIRTNRSEYLDQLLNLLPPVWKPSSVPLVDRLFSLQVGTAGLRKNGRQRHQLFEDQRTTLSSKDLDRVLEVFEQSLKIYLAEMARGRVFVHAGAVGWRGKAIVIPGASHSGKTTLVAALIEAGATYYSDEYAVLDRHGRVHPFPTPLGMREPGSLNQRRCQAEELGGETGTRPLPVGSVLVTRYRPGARWRPSRLSKGQAVLEMLAHTVPARRRAQAVMATLPKAVTDAIALKGARGEAQEVASLILES